MLVLPRTGSALPPSQAILPFASPSYMSRNNPATFCETPNHASMQCTRGSITFQRTVSCVPLSPMCARDLSRSLRGMMRG
jgi:hypothetical protein